MKGNRSVSKNLCNSGNPWVLISLLARDADIDSIVALWNGKMDGVSDPLGGNADEGMDHMFHADALADDLFAVNAV